MITNELFIEWVVWEKSKADSGGSQDGVSLTGGQQINDDW